MLGGVGDPEDQANHLSGVGVDRQDQQQVDEQDLSCSEGDSQEEDEEEAEADEADEFDHGDVVDIGGDSADSQHHRGG